MTVISAEQLLAVVQSSLDTVNAPGGVQVTVIDADQFMSGLNLIINPPTPTPAPAPPPPP